MPFPRTWSEELVTEWLQIEGYVVENGVLVSSGSTGGRKEADVVGVKIKNKILEIFHIEVGSLSGNPQVNEQMIRDKFSQSRKMSIEAYIRTKMDVDPSYKMKYKTQYIATWFSDRTLNYLKQKNLPVVGLYDLIMTQMKQSISNWKANPPHQPTTKGKSVTLPETLWLIKLVDYILEE